MAQGSRSGYVDLHSISTALPLDAEPWRHLLQDTDREVLARAGYGRRRGMGSTVALLAIDFQLAYLGANRPIGEQLDEWPTGGGEAAWQALAVTETLIVTARAGGHPVVFSRIAIPAEAASSDAFTAKRGHSEFFIEGHPGTRLALPVEPDDLVITKRAASAFFGTELKSLLDARGVDSLLVTGLSTSGCVRATVVDAASNGYFVAVVPEATADRITLSRSAALLDIHMKYGDLLSADEAASVLGQPA